MERAFVDRPARVGGPQATSGSEQGLRSVGPNLRVSRDTRSCGTTDHTDPNPSPLVLHPSCRSEQEGVKPSPASPMPVPKASDSGEPMSSEHSPFPS